jgi:hypothetical protein
VKRLPAERYWELRAEIEQEQGQLERRRSISRDAQPLKEALTVEEWTVQDWQARPVEWRRAIIKLVAERIEVRPTLRRGAPKGHLGAVHNPERVKVKLAA